MLNKAILAAAAATGTQDEYWIAKLSTANNNEYINGIAATSSGDTYFTGRYTNTNAYALIGKLNADGTLAWQRTLGNTSENQIGQDVALDSSGNIYVVISEQGFSHVTYVASYTASGTLRWQQKLQGCLLKRIVVDSSGNSYVAGYLTYGYPSAEAGLLVKYNSSGSLQWQGRLNDGWSTRFDGLALDASGNPLVCGYHFVSSYRRFITAKYNSSGTLQFQREISLTGDTCSAYAITSDSSSNVYVFGYLGGDLFAVKYNSSGTLSTYQAIDKSIQEIYDAATDANGELYVISSHSIGTYFSGTERRKDIYAVKFDNSLAVTWQRYLGTTNSEEGYAISTKSSTGMYLAGLTYSSTTTAPNGLVAFLPASGSLTGTYGSYYYDSVAWSTTSRSYLATTPSMTNTATTLTASSASLTDAAVTLTVTKTDVQ